MILIRLRLLYISVVQEPLYSTLLGPIRSQLWKQYPGQQSSLKVTTGQLGDTAGLIGAVNLFLNSVIKERVVSLFPIKTLLLSGENNHDWQRSTPFCKELLEITDRFSVDVALNPAAALSDQELLGQYSLIFTDYNGTDWGETARSNFEKAIREGAGLVVLHAANNAFRDWEEYKKIVGLTFVEGTSAHGDFHEFEVNITDGEHPITKQISDFKTKDELYHRTVPAPFAAYSVLAHAYSDPEQGGSGQYEPVIVVLQYGKGRIFHFMLGHVWPHDFNSGYAGFQMHAFENRDFQKCLVRGAEWAATGEVQD